MGTVAPKLVNIQYSFLVSLKVSEEQALSFRLQNVMSESKRRVAT